MNINDTLKKLKETITIKEDVKRISIIRHIWSYIPAKLDFLSYTPSHEKCRNEKVVTKMMVSDISLGGNCYEI